MKSPHYHVRFRRVEHRHLCSVWWAFSHVCVCMCGCVFGLLRRGGGRVMAAERMSFSCLLTTALLATILLPGKYIPASMHFWNLCILLTYWRQSINQPVLVGLGWGDFLPNWVSSVGIGQQKCLRVWTRRHEFLDPPVSSSELTWSTALYGQSFIEFLSLLLNRFGNRPLC